MRILCVFLILVFIGCDKSFAQGKNGFKPGKPSAEDFVLPASPAIDSNTNAVIISDMGVIDFTGNKSGWFSYIFKRRTRIKILNKKAFDLATVKIHLYINDEDQEKLSDVAASTYNAENGQVTETKLTKNELYTVKTDKNHIEQKFTMPAVKEGSVIEYSYTITSDFIFNMPSWEFQNIDYPCLWSEYQVAIPSLLVYVFDKRGVHPYFIDKSDIGHKTYIVPQTKDDRTPIAPDNPLSVSASTIKHRWVMKDVPAFYVENYLSSPVNYIDKIEFQLHQTNNGETSTDVMNTWNKATEELLKKQDFGAFMDSDENNYWLEKALAVIVKNNTDELQQARDIYYYVANNYTCTNYYDKYITTSLQDVYKKHSGTVGDINLLLTALLKGRQINASPVLLSTREFGYNYPGYPIMDRLNYVICRVVIDKKIYYLDAAHSNLGFNYLPDNCYNGHARIISRTDSASIYFMADSIKEKKVTVVNIFNDEKNKGGLTGNFQIQPGHIESYSLREAISKTGEKNYFDDIKTAARGDLEITRAWIDSLKEPENPVKVEGEFALKTGDNTDIIYFNPLMWEGYKTNPFAAAVRKYPVEMVYPLDETYILNMEIPNGFETDELPKMTKVVYNGGEGSFEYLLQKGETSIQFRCSLKFKRANFDSDDYNTLREFFGYIVKKEGEQIVFKRKK